MVMSVNPITSATTASASPAVLDVKRAALQIALLKKSVEMQQQQQLQQSREAEGLGNMLDIRV